MTIQFIQADIARDREALMRLNVDYLNWIDEGLREWFGLSAPSVLGMSIPDYVEGMLEKLCAAVPPEGVFYPVCNGHGAIGMGGLRCVREGVGEIKRIYTSRAARGGGIGALVVERLIRDAHTYGYRELVLESAPFMKSAHRLYEAAGFTDIAPFAEAEVPRALRHNWRFMRRELA